MKCLNCDNIVKRGHGIKKKVKYCSRECYLSRPATVVKLEEMFEDSIVNILKFQESRKTGQETKAALLGITRQTYRRYLEKYLRGGKMLNSNTAETIKDKKGNLGLIIASYNPGDYSFFYDRKWFPIKKGVKHAN